MTRNRVVAGLIVRLAPPTRNQYVAFMQIERSTRLPGDLDSVRQALLAPDLLSAWLGPWREGTDGRAIVVTDDGVRRAVTGHHVDDHGDVRWTWAPVDAPGDTSEVVVHLEDHGDAGTGVVVRETRLDTPTVAARAADVQSSSTRFVLPGSIS